MSSAGTVLIHCSIEVIFEVMSCACYLGMIVIVTSTVSLPEFFYTMKLLCNCCSHDTVFYLVFLPYLIPVVVG